MASMLRKNPYRELEKALGYRFRNQAILEAALTHRSYRFENEGIREDNQRLEFLGDAVLGFLMAAFAYRRFEKEDEGGMTRFRSHATSGKTLARIARQADLGRHILLGRGEQRAGGASRPSTLADALEAVMGAVFLDGGMKGAERAFMQLFASALQGNDPEIWGHNPKGELQETAQKVWRANPRYRVVEEQGPPHARVFTVEASVTDRFRANGSGNSKQDAESRAAAALLGVLREAGGSAPPRLNRPEPRQDREVQQWLPIDEPRAGPSSQEGDLIPG